MRFAVLELLQDSEEPPLDRQAVKQLEFELQVQFPDEYVEFLLQYNGGEFHRPIMCYVPNSSRWADGICIDFFLGAPGDRINRHGLPWYRETMEERVPNGFLPIADCGGLDMILLSVADMPSDIGQVWLWDGTEEGEGNNIHWLADSFNEFLGMLQYDTYFEDEDQETIPVFHAIERGNLPCVEQFLAGGGDKESRNADGLTLLAAAAKFSWPRIVRLLLDHGADANARDNQGRTPLHHAATHSYDSVKLLVAAGADAKARDQDGKSALAEWSYRIDQFLRAHGAED